MCCGQQLECPDNPIQLPLPPQELSPPPTLESLAALLGMGSVEKIILLLAAGVELDASFANTVSKASPGGPTVGLVVGLAPRDGWAALCPQAPLRRWRVIELQGSGPLTQRVLKIDERVLHHLLGVNYLDARLDGLIEPLLDAPLLTRSQAALTAKLREAWSATPDGSWPCLQLFGRDTSGKHAIALELCVGMGFRLFRLAPGDIPGSSTERSALARLCDRELALSNTALLIERAGPRTSDDEDRMIARLADALTGPVIVATEDPVPLESSQRLRFEVPPASQEERRELWRRLMGSQAQTLGDGLDRLAEQFSLDGAGIRAVSEVVAAVSTPEDTNPFDRLWDSCRMQARRGLDDLAERIESRMTWDDLVLPPDRREQLGDIAVQVRQAHRVYHSWGWAAKSARGLGAAALFSGPSGVGKTLAAEVLASDLRLDLYRIDLSQVVNKYIGETEKNLRRIFEAAESSGAILLFDEADALFGKRSEVKDSHDRFANVEVSYLLQRMESYRGLAILTTNQKSALDKAFLRRLRFVVDFPFPDARLRAAIWERMFPMETPVNRIDIARLARLTIAGGNIRTIALNATFLAAADGGEVKTSHVLAAARREYAKLEKPITSAEFGGAA